MMTTAGIVGTVLLIFVVILALIFIFGQDGPSDPGEDEQWPY